MVIAIKNTAPKIVTLERKFVLRLKICPIVPKGLAGARNNALRKRTIDEEHRRGANPLVRGIVASGELREIANRR
jgi:hypothetical protein